MKSLAIFIIVLVSLPCVGQEVPVRLSTETSGPCAGRLAYFLTLAVDESTDLYRDVDSPLRIELKAEDIWSRVGLSTGDCHYTVKISAAAPVLNSADARTLQLYSGVSAFRGPAAAQLLGRTSSGRERTAALELLKKIRHIIERNTPVGSMRMDE